MKTYKLAMAAFGFLILVACGTSPPAASPSQTTAVSRPDVVLETTAASADTDANESGLGTLASNGRDLINCGRTMRTGTRIPREICDPNSFNGLYPSPGMSMSTAKEVGPSWGN